MMFGRRGAPGNMVFIGNTMYMTGGPTLRYGDVSALLKPGR